MKWLMIFLILKGGVSKMENIERSKKILMIIAHRNFRDEELLVPKKMFEEHGYKVTVASTDTSPAKGMLGAEVTPDAVVYDVDFNEYDAVVLVGGMGAPVYWEDTSLHKKLVDFYKNEKKVLAAICLAPVTLAKAGLLKDKKATCWKSAGEEINKAGGKYTGKDVEVTERIVTGNGPGAAEKFAREILRLLGE
ncbi:MAG: DJ-1/PfpI family protein [Candidatus Hydrothermae bacterium]|nr:DJ-1/PfpI family protein [Candidatus Hydrothermae bacterium]